MPNERKRSPRPFVALFIGFMGFAALSNVASKPRFQTFHAVDVVGLLAAGTCFGVAICVLVTFLRRSRWN
jgi:hypothetical protein